MTTSDWVGLTVTILVFIGMAYTFYKALKPSKRDELEQEKYKILDD
jgi:cytochrome c oxidase cbb3-type subunit 4